MIDFSKISVDIDTSAPVCPYAYDNKHHFVREFQGKAPARSAIKVGLDERRSMASPGDLTVKASHGDTAFEVVLIGQRSDDWVKVVHASLITKREQILDEYDHPEEVEEVDWDKADGVTTEVNVEGFWKKRWFKNHQNKWVSVLQFHVARFTHGDTTKGQMPEMG